MNKKKLPENNTKNRKPDIAFWFNPDDPTHYETSYKEGLPLICFIQASFDLYAKALDRQDDALIVEGKE